VVEPQGQAPQQWRFTTIAVSKVKRANRLQQDLGINVAGVALAIELLDKIAELEQTVANLKEPLNNSGIALRDL
jgi:chaperone modulatory protein CbpM